MEKETAWWAIISETLEEQSVSDWLPSEPSPLNETEPLYQEQSALAIAKTQHEAWQQRYLGGYLDAQKRYQIEQSTDCQLSPPQYDSSVLRWQTRVIDLHPNAKAGLEEKLDRLEILIEKGADPLDFSDVGIPPIALPYLSLQELVPTLPEIYDAWYEGKKEIILLGDRSQWQRLSSWAQTPQPWLQVLHYLTEMVHLWQHLSEVNCCQSLLLETNLRIDEDQILGVQQLYRDPAEAPPLLALVQMWQELFAQVDKTEQILLQLLFEKVASGVIQTAQQLQHHLRGLAQQQQTHPDFDSEILEQDDSCDTALELTADSQNEGLPTVVLPMELRRLEDCGATNVGRERNQNEDAFSLYTQISKQEDNQGKKLSVRGLYILCDGMGGHAKGEIASATAVETLESYFREHWHDHLPDRETIREGILLANQVIYRANSQNSSTGNSRMGTTLALALVQNTQVAIAHVGDSRIYRITRKQGIEQLSLDHAVAQQNILRGMDPEIAYARPDAYHLTQALGPSANDMVEPDIQFFTVREDTLFLLCSDGLSDNEFLQVHGEQQVNSLISGSVDLEQRLLTLIELANQHNGHDNITLIMLRMQVRPRLEP